MYAFNDNNDSTSSKDTPLLQADSTITFTMSTLVIAGVTYAKNSAKKVISNTIVEQVLHKKQTRAKLPAKDHTLLFEKATKQGHKKFDLLPLALNDEDKLDDTYSLEVLIRKMKRQHCTFTIIYPDPVKERQVASTLDLYTEFAKISIEDVAQSNLWYCKWLSDPGLRRTSSLPTTTFRPMSLMTSG
jgi:hypothetical protein